MVRRPAAQRLAEWVGEHGTNAHGPAAAGEWSAAAATDHSALSPVPRLRRAERDGEPRAAALHGVEEAPSDGAPRHGSVQL